MFFRIVLNNSVDADSWLDKFAYAFKIERPTMGKPFIVWNNGGSARAVAKLSPGAEMDEDDKGNRFKSAESGKLVLQLTFEKLVPNTVLDAMETPKYEPMDWGRIQDIFMEFFQLLIWNSNTTTGPYAVEPDMPHMWPGTKLYELAVREGDLE